MVQSFLVFIASVLFSSILSATVPTVIRPAPEEEKLEVAAGRCHLQKRKDLRSGTGRDTPGDQEGGLEEKSFQELEKSFQELEEKSFQELEGSRTGIMSVQGTTGPGVPQAMKSWLESTGVPIEENAKTYYGSAKAVEAMEHKCGWDPETSTFRNDNCTASFNFTTAGQSFVANPDELDIVVPSIRNLSFLNDWREFFQGFHVIIVQDGDPDKFLEIPNWVDYELYNRKDIEAVVGEKAWLLARGTPRSGISVSLCQKNHMCTLSMTIACPRWMSRAS
jgi:hypothetical protein